MDIISFLTDNGVKVFDEGEKNVSMGWIGIQCPFCGDKSNHFGINLKTLRCNCWKCGSHNIVTIICEVAECSKKRAREIVKGLDQVPNIEYYDSREEEVKRFIKFPPTVTPLPKQYKEYLSNRGFNPDRIAKKYNLSACLNETKYQFRIIIPMYLRHKLVCFTARAIFQDIALKYKHPEKYETIYTPKQLIYNYDSFEGGTDLVVCEGPTDVWKWGAGAVATNGINFTSDQILILRSKPIRQLFIFFDNEPKAQSAARFLMKILAPYPETIERVVPKYKRDPGEMSLSDIINIKEMLHFNYEL